MRRPAHRRMIGWRALFVIALLACAGNAISASLQVAPTTLTLQARQTADGLWLSNSGDAPVQVQLRVFRWTQADGKDVLETTRDLVVSPPIQTLPPGEQQLVRVIRTQPVPPVAETSYRVIVDELPVDQDAQPGLRFVLRYSIPIFVVPESAAKPGAVLSTRLVTLDDGNAAIQVSNSGTQHAQLADLGFIGPSGERETVIAGLVGYVLPGQTMRWPLPSSVSRFADGTFKARINSEADEQSLPLAAAR